MKTKKIIICLLMIFFLLSSGCGNENTYKNNAEIKNEFTVNNVCMSAGINSHIFDAQISSSFYTNSKNIYITGRYENADKNSFIKFIWKYNKKIIHEDTLLCNEFSSDNFKIFLTSVTLWKTGNYCVEMYINNNQAPAKTLNFAIKSSLDYSCSTVYITRTGAKYHISGCRCLSKSKIPILLKNAKKRGFKPCGICKPPG